MLRPPRIVIVPVVAALGCSGDPSTSEEAAPVETRTSALTPSTYAKGQQLTLEAVEKSREEARAELTATNRVEIWNRKSACFTMIQAVGAPLDQARDETDRMATLLRFLTSHGSALVDRGKPGLSGTAQLEVVRPGLVSRRGSTESVQVILRQRVDEFGLADSLVGGRFVGNDLVSVSGCLVDPSSAAPRVTSLALPNEDAARSAMEAELGTDAMASPAKIKGRFHGRHGFVRWVYKRHQFDAETGAYLGEISEDHVDPETSTDTSTQSGQ